MGEALAVESPIQVAAEALRQAGVKVGLTETTWPSDMSREEFASAYSLLLSLAGLSRVATNFALGDGYVFCQEHFGEDVTQQIFTDLPEHKYHSVQNLASTCRAFPPSLRKEGVRDWSIYTQLQSADLETKQKWLKVASNGTLKVRELESALKSVKKQNALPAAPKEQPAWTGGGKQPNGPDAPMTAKEAGGILADKVREEREAREAEALQSRREPEPDTVEETAELDEALGLHEKATGVTLVGVAQAVDVGELGDIGGELPAHEPAEEDAAIGGSATGANPLAGPLPTFTEADPSTVTLPGGREGLKASDVQDLERQAIAIHAREQGVDLHAGCVSRSDFDAIVVKVDEHLRARQEAEAEVRNLQSQLDAYVDSCCVLTAHAKEALHKLRMRRLQPGGEMEDAEETLEWALVGWLREKERKSK